MRFFLQGRREQLSTAPNPLLLSPHQPYPFVSQTPQLHLAAMKLVLAAATVGAAQAFIAPSAFSGASLSSSRVTAASTPRMSLAEYKEELAATAKAIAGPGEYPQALLLQG